MACSVIQLPSGTSLTKIINVPTSGSWLGGIVISICSAAQISVVSLEALNPFVVSSNVKYTGYRKIGADNPYGQTTNWTLAADTRIYRLLFKDETMAKLKYTCTSEVSFTIETNRDWNAVTYPTTQGACQYAGDGTITWVAQ